MKREHQAFCIIAFFFFLLPGAARASWSPSELLLNVRKVQLGVISPPEQEQGRGGGVCESQWLTVVCTAQYLQKHNDY